MSRPLAVLRPEPGNAATAARIEAAGLSALRLPLFETRALDWRVPDAGDFDALLLTSANAPRLAGDGLARLARLPSYVVGDATAAAARAAGLIVAMTGTADGAALLAAAEAAGVRRALLLSGRERVLDSGGIVAQAIAVYASEPRSLTRSELDSLAGSVALLHSPRAARRLSALVGRDDRTAVRIAALSRAVADAASPGWAQIAAADVPTDDALLALARRLAD